VRALDRLPAPAPAPAPAGGPTLVEALVGTVRQPLLALDRDLNVRLANRAFRRFFGVSVLEIEGRSLVELAGRLWDVPPLRALEVARPEGGVRSLLVNARSLSVGARS
jgi:PAS domain-containing protein